MPRHQLQYTAVTEPAFVPAPRVSAWLPDLPHDVPRAKPRFFALAMATAFAVGAVSPTPVYVATAEATTVPVVQQFQYKAVTAPVSPTPTVTPLSWAAKYADRAPGPAPRPPTQTVAPLGNLPTVPALSWAPVVAQPVRPAWRPLGGTTDAGRPDIGLSWAPLYPHPAARYGPFPMRGSGGTRPATPAPPAAVTFFAAVYPDRVPAATRTPHAAGWFAEVPPAVPFHWFESLNQPERVPPLPWRPAAYTTAGPGYYVNMLLNLPTVPPRSWAPVYPDRVPAAPPRGEGAAVWNLQNTPQVTPLSWRPIAPDFARAAPPRPAGFTVAPLLNAPTVTPLSWAPVYPERVRVVRTPAGTLAAPIGNLPTVTPLSWAPVLPVAAPGPRRPLVLGGHLGPLVPLLVVPPLAWDPEYPDFARAAAPRPAGWQVWAPVNLPSVPGIGWLPIFPARVPAALRAQPTVGAFLNWYPAHDPARAIEWLPVYPGSTTAFWRNVPNFASWTLAQRATIFPDAGFTPGGEVPLPPLTVPGGAILIIGEWATWQHHHDRPGRPSRDG